MAQELGSVTVWLARLKAGDSEAVQPLWERYFQRLVALARRRGAGLRDKGTDEEDVALLAFDSFIRGVERGRFPRLNDRNDLWQVLYRLTADKVINLWVREGRLKHGERRVVHASELLDERAGREPSPEEAALFNDEVAKRLSDLTEEEEAVAILKLGGYTNEEVRERLGCSLATVERRLKGIRTKWGAPP
jgi:RNA polymerase sigma factor (sigma-70 family)